MERSVKKKEKKHILMVWLENEHRLSTQQWSLLFVVMVLCLYGNMKIFRKTKEYNDTNNTCNLISLKR